MDIMAYFKSSIPFLYELFPFSNELCPFRMKNRNVQWPISNLVCHFSNEQSKCTMDLLLWEVCCPQDPPSCAFFPTSLSMSDLPLWEVCEIFQIINFYNGLFQIQYALFPTNYALFPTKNQNLQWPISNLVCPYLNEQFKCTMDFHLW